MRAQASIARRIGIGLVAVCATLLTASCATGQHAATADNTPALDGTNGVAGSISLHAVAIKPPAVSCYLPGSDAALTLVIVNTGSTKATLAGVSSPRFKSAVVTADAADAATYLQAAPGAGSCAPVASGASTAPAAPAPSASLPAAVGQQALAPGESLQLGLTDTGTDTSGKPVVLLQGLQNGPLYPGESVPVTFDFGAAGSATLTVPVQLSVAPNDSVIPSVSNTIGNG